MERVIINEIQGNSLANYALDSDREFPLNGDIDLQGEILSTDEGNEGYIDVSLEGNTFVNLISGFSHLTNNKNLVTTYSNNVLTYGASSTFSGDIYPANIARFVDLKDRIIANRKYTLLFNGLQNNFTMGITGLNASGAHLNNTLKTVECNSGINKLVFDYTQELLEQISYFGIRFTYTETKNNHSFSDFIILEGDYTDKEIPPYFEGMKSVGEGLDKFEILSRNKNLIETTRTFPYPITSTVNKGKNVGVVHCKPNTQYSISLKTTNEKGIVTCVCSPKRYSSIQLDSLGFQGDCYNNSKNFYGTTKFEWEVVGTDTKTTFITPHSANYIYINSDHRFGTDFEINEIQLEYGNIGTSYVNPKLNKKEILLNEPLRSANEIYKDKFVKIGSKWFIERNTKEVVLNGTQQVYISGTSVTDETLCRFDFKGIDGVISGQGIGKQFVCDTLPYLFIHALQGGSGNVTQECITNHSASTDINIIIKKTRLETIDVDGLNKWLSINNIKIIIPISTPTYEPLLIEPTLNTYTDITHISNNSIIPCNMKVKNTGYDCVLKPNTTYTVIGDCEGELGVNLGGAKATSSNNVITLTTPATLEDNQCRLFGKGINTKGCTVVERDLTNKFIPERFEGITSVGRLCKNECTTQGTAVGLIDKYDGTVLTGGTYNSYRTINGYVEIEPKILYTATCYINDKRLICRQFVFDENKKIIQDSTTGSIETLENAKYMRLSVDLRNDDDLEFADVLKFQIEKGKYATDYEERYEGYYLGLVSRDEKGNEVGRYDLFLDEPLRSVDEVKDKIYIKDKSAVIERNCSSEDFSNTVPIINKLNTPTYETYDINLPHGNFSLDVPNGGEFEVITNLNPTLKTTISNEFDGRMLKLPIELNKVGNVKDRVYWDNTKGHYVVEQKIGKNSLEDYNNAKLSEIYYELAEPIVIDLPQYNERIELKTPSFMDMEV